MDGFQVEGNALQVLNDMHIASNFSIVVLIIDDVKDLVRSYTQVSFHFVKKVRESNDPLVS